MKGRKVRDKRKRKGKGRRRRTIRANNKSNLILMH
jgi:hypothetical protein